MGAFKKKKKKEKRKRIGAKRQNPISLSLSFISIRLHFPPIWVSVVRVFQGYAIMAICITTNLQVQCNDYTV